MIRFLNAFAKITGYPLQWCCFRTKVHYEDKKAQSRRIKGPAIIISNHTSVYDYAVFLFVFPTRTLRYQMAEVLFKKKAQANFLKCMGGIMVDRDAYDFSFIGKSLEVLEKGGVLGIFPESRLPRKDETPPIEFKTSAAYIALQSGVPIIPLYTNGSYFKKKRARVIVGKQIDARALLDGSLSEKENIANITNILRQKVIELKDELERQTTKKTKAD